jgi:hypothetical protein
MFIISRYTEMSLSKDKTSISLKSALVQLNLVCWIELCLCTTLGKYCIDTFSLLDRKILDFTSCLLLTFSIAISIPLYSFDSFKLSSTSLSISYFPLILAPSYFNTASSGCYRKVNQLQPANCYGTWRPFLNVCGYGAQNFYCLRSYESSVS